LQKGEELKIADYKELSKFTDLQAMWNSKKKKSFQIAIVCFYQPTKLPILFFLMDNNWWIL
jgi:hypothetical protein